MKVILLHDGQKDVKLCVWQIFVDGEHIATRGEGDCFGEIALLESTERTATVISNSELVLLTLTREQFQQFSVACPRFEETCSRTANQRRPSLALSLVETVDGWNGLRAEAFDGSVLHMHVWLCCMYSMVLEMLFRKNAPPFSCAPLDSHCL